MEVEYEAQGLGLPGRGVLSPYKLFAVDLDGTLLDYATGRPHPRDADALRALSRKGIRTTILTGRLLSGTRHVAREVGIEGAIGCADGSHLAWAASGDDIEHVGLVGEHAALVRDVLARVTAVTFVFAHDQIVHDVAGRDYVPYVRTWSNEVVEVERATEHPHWGHPRGVTAVVTVGEEEQIAEAERALARGLGGEALTVVFPVRKRPGLQAMLVRAAGYTKGTALARIAAIEGVRTDEVVVVGDWWNDVPMFGVAGRSFVMAQAPDEVKATATDALRASSEKGGGVAEAAERAGLL